MEFSFPKYPFFWNYDDMYNIINYTSKEINPNEYDEYTKLLLEKFPNYKIIKSNQIIKSKEEIKNLNIHTWYLSQLNIFENDEFNIKILTNSKFKYKNNVKCFIFDPYNIFKNLDYDKKNKKEENIVIIKKHTSIFPELIPSLYIHTHNIKGIFRFSPNNNSKVILNKDSLENICYIILDKIIVIIEITNS